MKCRDALVSTHRSWDGFIALHAYVLTPLRAFAILQGCQETALGISGGRGHDEVVKLLLQHGAKINHQVSSVDLCSACVLPLHCFIAAALMCPCIQECDVHTSSSSLNHVCNCSVCRT